MDIASRAQPDVAIAASGWLAPPDSIDRPVTLWHTYRGDPPARRKATMVKSAVEVDIVQGHSGYLVQPSFFDLDALVHGYDEAPREAFFQDDIWISGHCKVRKLVLPARRFCFVSWRRVGLYDRTSLESRASSQSIEKHPNNVMLRYLEDRWLVHSESISAPR